MEPIDEVSEVDRLIADAEAAAREVTIATTVEERMTAATKKKDSAAAAERTEEVMRIFSSLRADDANVEDYCYEWVFDAYEAQLNIARPPKVQASIDALKKTGEALRKLAAVDQMSPALEAKMQALQALHDRLFDDVQSATVEALDQIKKKFKGEETEFERRFKVLSESPLIRGVEYDTESPEARERGLKQEIVEVILEPIAESRLKGMDTDIDSRRTHLEAWKASYIKLQSENSYWLKKDEWKETEVPYPLRRFLAELYGTNEYEVKRNRTPIGVEQEVTRIFEARQKAIDALEQASLRDRLAFEMNRRLIDETLLEVHDETELREAFVALRSFLSDVRSKINSSSFPDPENVGKKFPYDNPLATLILGRLKRYGADLSVVYVDGDRTKYDKVPIDQQLIGRQIETSEHQRWTAANSLQGFAVHGFIRVKLFKATNEYAGRGYGSTPDDAATFYDDLSSEMDPGNDLKKAYPTKEDYLKALFGGETRFFNLRLAYDKAAAELVKDKPRSVGEPARGVDALKTVGWKESRLGALVDPNQSVRDADREYARLLEQFSKPQVDAEALFDVRDETGEFHVYTTDQAMRLLRRARRDARDIVLGADRTVAQEKSGSVTVREGAEREVAQLTARVEELQAQLATNTAESNKALASAKSAGEEAVKSERANARQSKMYYEGQVAAAQKERDALAERLRTQLATALRVKGGMFSGDKELRDAVTRVLEGLPEKK